MTRRPLCLACLLLIVSMYLAGWMGVPVIKGNPLPDSVREWIAQHPDAVVCGEAVRCVRTENSQSVYLKNTFLADRPNKIPIENIRIFFEEKQDIRIGSVLTIAGKLESIEGPRNPGEFDSRQYYAAERIYYFMKECKIVQQSKTYSRYGQTLEEIRNRIKDIFQKNAGNDAAIFEAMILGEKGNLDNETKIRYQMAGIIHILAISGLHISLLGMGLFNLMVKIGSGLWSAGMISLMVMLQYGLLAGGSVSTMRAVCMFLLMVGAKMLGRCYDMLTALCISAILLLLDSPAYLYNSSFLMSFGAVLGIGIVFPSLSPIFGVKHKILKAFLASLSVQLTTLPIVLFFYGEVSITGIFLNLFILPTVGIILISGVCGACVGLICCQGAWVALLPGRGLLYLYSITCYLAGKIPYCTWIAGKPYWWQIVLYYIMLILALWYGNFWVKKVYEKAEIKKYLIKGVCVFLISIGVLSLNLRIFDGLSVTFLDVGQGDGIVLESKENCFMIDGGSSNKTNVGQYQILPYLKSQGIQFIDLVFISHTDEDHISGIRQIFEFIRNGFTAVNIGGLVLPKWEQKPTAYEELEKIAKQAGVSVWYAQKGDVLQVGSLTFSFYGPLEPEGTDINEDGIVMEVSFGKFKALFPGDIGIETEKGIISELKKVDLLKTAHHGSKNSTGKEFLEKVSPKIAVISCSESNRYGHPAKETVQRLEESGCKIEYTMKNGAIMIHTDGEKIWMNHYVEE